MIASIHRTTHEIERIFQLVYEYTLNLDHPLYGGDPLERLQACYADIGVCVGHPHSESIEN